MMLESQVTNQIINVYYKVYNYLGYGFLEKVYQNAMFLELKKSGFYVQAQHKIDVHYHDIVIGEYYADLIVNEKVIIELKAAEILIEKHQAQLVNYLKATNIEVGLLFNFGEKPEFKRKIFTNDRKIRENQ